MTLYGAIGQLTRPSKAAAVPWWLSGGISPANCVAAYQPKGAASYAASKINLANPGTYDAYEGVAPAWNVATGWDFKATSGHLETSIIPSSLDWSMICSFSGGTSGIATTIIGAWTEFGGNGALLIQPNADGTNRRYFNGSGLAITNGQVMSGIMAIAGRKAYLNGIEETGNIPTGYAITTQIIIGALFFRSYVQFARYVQSCAIYNSTLSSNQILLLTNAMNAL